MMNKSIEEFWREFHKHVESASKGGLPTIFRGVSNKKYELIPSIGRNTKDGTNGNIEILESNLIAEFKRLSLPELKIIPKLEIEWLFLAQHYGLPTRLLDWSSNPMVALFFAVHGNEDFDGAFYISKHIMANQYEQYDYRTADISDEEKKNSPISKIFGISDQGKVIFTRPKYTDQRYINQKSVFSCPSDPFIPLKIEYCEKIIIDKEHKEPIRKLLKTIGISHSYIYPGLSGIAEEVKDIQFNLLQKGKLEMLSFKSRISLPEYIIK